jgi:chitodextrinase
VRGVCWVVLSLVSKGAFSPKGSALVGAPPPSAQIIAPYQVRVGQNVYIFAVASGDQLEYAWDFGDGATAAGESVYHTYSEPGNYLLTLAVTDKYEQSQCVTQKITID